MGLWAFLLLLSGGTLGAGLPSASPANQRIPLLVPGFGVERAIRASENQTFRISGQPDRLIEFDLDSGGATLAVDLLDPRGGLVLSITSLVRGGIPRTLSAVAEILGSYRLTLKVASSGEPGKYRLILKPLRSPTMAERNRAAAIRHLTEGNVAVSDKQARAYLQQALQLWEPEDHCERGLTLRSLARRQAQEDSPAALSSLRDAQQEFEASSCPSSALVVIEEIAAAICRGDPRRALEGHNQALQGFERLGDRAGQADALANMALAYKSLGDSKHALSLYSRALEFWEELRDKQSQATLLFNIGQLYLDSKLPKYALAWFEEALQRGGHGELTQLILSSKGLAHSYLHENGPALHDLRAALAMARLAGSKKQEVVDLNRLGVIFLDANRFKKALRYFEEARKIALAIQDPRDEGYAIDLAGWARQKEGHSAEALRLLTAAVSLFHKTEDKNAESGALFGIAQAHRSLGNLAESRKAIEESLALSESLRTLSSSLNVRSSFWAEVRPRYEFYIDLLWELDHGRGSRAFTVPAFNATERARARAVLDELAESGSGLQASAAPTLVDSEKKLLIKLAQVEEERLSLRRRATEPKIARRLDFLDATVADLRARLDLAQAERRASSPRYSVLLHESPLTLEKIQSDLLDQDTVLLVYWLGTARSFLWRIDRRSVSAYELPARKLIEEAANGLRDHVSPDRLRVGREEATRLVSTLSRELLAPVAGKLKSRRIGVLAEGALLYVPFAALFEPKSTTTVSADESVRPLITEHEIVSLPSASTLATLRKERLGRRPPPQQLAVVGDPVFRRDDPRIRRRSNDPPTPRVPETSSPDLDLEHLPMLSSSRHEAERLLDLVPNGKKFAALGFAANLDTVTGGQLGNSRVIHFSTHSLLNENSDLSGLVLSLFDERGNRRLGFLPALRIYDLNLPVDLVVLGACRTAQGGDQSGEGIGRMARGFLFAGAKSVIVSLWSVDDEATSMLMINFYRFLFVNGLSPEAALREAQLCIRQQKVWESPYYWAGFILQGDWGPLGRHPTNSGAQCLIN